jgi:hypothetical protein
MVANKERTLRTTISSRDAATIAQDVAISERRPQKSGLLEASVAP